MLAVLIEICRHFDDSQPGWVECKLADARGREWMFVEKVPVVTVEDLDATSSYPRSGAIACRVVDRRVAADYEIVTIDTTEPWGVEAVNGETRFEVRSDQFVSEC